MEIASTHAKTLIETLLNVHALTCMHRASENDEYRRSAVDWLASLERQFAALKRSLDATPSPSPVSAPSPAGGDLMSDSRLDMAWADGAKAAMNAMSDFLPDAPAVREMDRIISQRQTDAIAGRKSAKPNPSPAGGVREAVARIIDPHSFVPYEPTGAAEDAVFADMVKSSLEDAYRKADRILALSSPATPEPVSAPANGEVGAISEMFGRWQSGYGFNDDSEEDVELNERVEAEIAALSNPAPGHGEGGL